MVRSGVTAVVCSSVPEARRAAAAMEAADINAPANVSLTAVGCDGHDAPSSGYFVAPKLIAESVLGFLKDPPPRPTTLWMSGAWIDRGTFAPIPAGLPLDAPSPFRVSGVTV
jgi:hypothetical protein